MQKLNAFQIKIFMITIMVLDHVDKTGMISGDLSNIFHLISRFVAVWFGYLVVEGFFHTRSKMKYNVRLFLWAGIMFAGNTILNFLYNSKEIHIFNNIFLTFAVSVLILNILQYKSDKFNPNKLIRILLIIPICIAGVFFTEGGQVLIPFILITYAFRSNSKYRNIGYVLLAILLFAISFVPYDTWQETIKMLMFNSDWMFITVIPFLYLYNGDRGLNNSFSKYLFYVFYPLHIWLFATIGYFIK